MSRFLADARPGNWDESCPRFGRIGLRGPYTEIVEREWGPEEKASEACFRSCGKYCERDAEKLSFSVILGRAISAQLLVCWSLVGAGVLLDGMFD